MRGVHGWRRREREALWVLRSLCGTPSICNACQHPLMPVHGTATLILRPRFSRGRKRPKSGMDGAAMRRHKSQKCKERAALFEQDVLRVIPNHPVALGLRFEETAPWGARNPHEGVRRIGPWEAPATEGRRGVMGVTGEGGGRWGVMGRRWSSLRGHDSVLDAPK